MITNPRDCFEKLKEHNRSGLLYIQWESEDHKLWTTYRTNTVWNYEVSNADTLYVNFCYRMYNSLGFGMFDDNSKVKLTMEYAQCEKGPFQSKKVKGVIGESNIRKWVSNNYLQILSKVTHISDI